METPIVIVNPLYDPLAIQTPVEMAEIPDDVGAIFRRRPIVRERFARAWRSIEAYKALIDSHAANGGVLIATWGLKCQPQVTMKLEVFTQDFEDAQRFEAMVRILRHDVVRYALDRLDDRVGCYIEFEPGGFGRWVRDLRRTDPQRPFSSASKFTVYGDSMLESIVPAMRSLRDAGFEAQIGDITPFC